MTTIYLVRHAEAEGNLYRIAQGQHESALTDRGWRQVRALRERFLSIPVDAVYTSDLYRAKATATAISQPKGLPLHGVPALREICVGEWEGRTWGDIARRESDKMAQFSHEIDRWRIPGAETPRAVLERVRDAVLSIAAENDGKTVAIVSHGYAIRLLLANIEGLSLAQTGATLHGDNTAVSLLEAENGTLRLVYRDDNAHLKTPEFLAHEKPIRRQNALEPGLWFAPLSPEEPLFRAFTEEFSLPPLPECRLWAGYLDTEPVGLLALGRETGWIAAACIREGYRKRGFGMQLIGQAVQHTRREGGTRLYGLAPPESAFYSGNGFSPSGGTREDGTIVWEKDIRFPSLSEGGFREQTENGQEAA